MRAQTDQPELCDEAELATAEALPHLAPAMDSLSRSDREAVLLRFYGNAAHQEVGCALGVSEEAAKKRVNRAVEKLRLFFLRRGITLTAGAVVSVIATSASEAAPAGLATAASQAALTAGIGTAAGAAQTLALAKGTLKMMLMAKVQAAALGTAAVLTAGTLAVTVVPKVTPPPAEATRTQSAARPATALILRQQEIPISVRDTNGAIYVAVQTRHLDAAPRSMWDAVRMTGMHSDYMYPLRLTRDEQMRLQILLEEAWKESDVLEQAFKVTEEGGTVTLELTSADRFLSLQESLSTNFLRKASEALGPDRTEIMNWFSASRRRILPWPVAARPTRGTISYRLALSRDRTAAAPTLQSSLRAQGELDLDNQALRRDDPDGVFTLQQSISSPFPLFWPALGERLGIPSAGVSAGIQENRRNFWARFDNLGRSPLLFAKWFEQAFRDPRQELSMAPVGAESLSGDWQGVFIPVGKLGLIQDFARMAKPSEASPGVPAGRPYALAPVWTDTLKLAPREAEELCGVLTRAVEAMDRACAEGLRVTRKSDDVIDCEVSTNSFARFPDILKQMRAEAKTALGSDEKADIVYAFACDFVPVGTTAAEVIWQMYQGHTDSVTKGTVLRTRRQRTGDSEKFNLSDPTPGVRGPYMGAVTTDRQGLPKFVAVLWSSGTAASDDAYMPAKVKLLDAQRLLRDAKFDDAIPAFEAARESAAGGPDELNAEITYWLGETYLRSGNTEKALAVYRELLSKYPSTRWAPYARGRIAERDRPK